MITVDFPDVGVLGEFEVAESQPNYWQERLAYTLLQLLRDCNDAGLEIRELELSDVQAQVSALNSAITDAYNDIDGLYSGGE